MDQELREPKINHDHNLSTWNVKHGVKYSQNRWCFQNSYSTRLIGKYIFQEKIYVPNCNTYNQPEIKDKKEDQNFNFKFPTNICLTYDKCNY